MKMTNEQYDLAKKIITQWSPALGVLIAGIATLYDFDATKIVGVISLVTAFAGVVLGVSSNNYNSQDYGDGQEFTERKDD
ncbi:phage holin [Enterococcus gallinarum]|jgi:hypothetical protein|uniref:phage holin n=1 Tax=Enterococcus gallinarum TaxID=1353 RepID=UPI001C36EFF5|nr:phage holin [Enterococcus gallinarum]MDT2695409.1 phage holin [Enterococcus gallinarum]DAM66172.1 MAG TPA: holin [Caudoviricetes sp.]HBH6526849.1 holin [Enterococcus faecium]